MKKVFYNNKVIETFVFDLDGTAFGYNDCVASINSEGKVLEYICNRFTHVSIQDIYQISQACMDVDRKKWFMGILKQIIMDYPKTSPEFDIDSFADDLESLYWVTFTQLNIPYFDFIYFIEKIRSFCKIAIITDGYIRNQKIKIFSSGLHKYFDFNNIVYSDEINSKKPSREIFDYAQKKIGYDPKTTAYIGDLLGKDIVGANNAGLLSVFLKRGTNISDIPKNQNQEPHITISNYYELLNLLEIM
ncbi:MAG: HAD family hydrolase [Clostridia bacterium]|nr:HAD family hydrolase [Clostridia bacterium]